MRSTVAMVTGCDIAPATISAMPAAMTSFARRVSFSVFVFAIAPLAASDTIRSAAGRHVRYTQTNDFGSDPRTRNLRRAKGTWGDDKGLGIALILSQTLSC